MNEHYFWTGLADFKTDYMPLNAIGVVARIVTHAESYEAFYEKVDQMYRNEGWVLNYINESSRVSEFLFEEWVTEDHEIHEMLEQAKKCPNDVVHGEFAYYTHNDA